MGGAKRFGWGSALSAALCVFALSAPASGVAKSGPGSFEPGTYRGRTSQGLPITLTVSRTTVISVEFEWRARCADGQRHRNGISAGGGQISRSSFSLGGTLNTGGKVHVDGKLRGRVAWGHLSRWGPSAFGTFNCPARGVRWKAYLKRASDAPQSSVTAFSGTTSQGLPINFSVTATSVRSLSFSWTALCADGQHHTNSIFGGDALLNQGSFSMGGTLNTGGTFQVDGVVNGTTASGTLSRSGPSAFGTFDCTASGVTWQAQATNARR
jgi:hypothetical protein